MDLVFPKTKLSRGSLSGPTQLVVAILLMLSAIHLINRWFQDGILMSGVLGLLLVIAAFPFFVRWQDYSNGGCRIYYCDEKIIAIRATPRKMQDAMLDDVERIVRDCLGYTIVLKNGRRFRVRHKDAWPQHAKMLEHWHAKMQIAHQPPLDSSDPPAA